MTRLAQGALDAENPSGGVRVLRSGTGRGYLGPAPIKAHRPHRYVFQLFALATPVTAGSPDAALDTARPRDVLAAPPRRADCRRRRPRRCGLGAWSRSAASEDRCRRLLPGYWWARAVADDAGAVQPSSGPKQGPRRSRSRRCEVKRRSWIGRGRGRGRIVEPVLMRHLVR
ncbi:hypothetical protein ABT168_02045 [Streptomyces sp. NPDC001793]|uniref:hypothetical protein n=1 Tax=Streptomyces sp. NPDC001793 TaxID=3154657 RepID=UPI00332AE15D